MQEKEVINKKEIVSMLIIASSNLISGINNVLADEFYEGEDLMKLPDEEFEKQFPKFEDTVDGAIAKSLYVIFHATALLGLSTEAIGNMYEIIKRDVNNTMKDMEYQMYEELIKSTGNGRFQS